MELNVWCLIFVNRVTYTVPIRIRSEGFFIDRDAHHLNYLNLSACYLSFKVKVR